MPTNPTTKISQHAVEIDLATREHRVGKLGLIDGMSR